jgi:hypothetical protein
MEKEYTKEQVLEFKESDWEFRRSSGYAGYDHKDSPNNEQTWIYENDYSKRKSLKAQYEYEYKLISDFRLDQLPFGEYPDYHIQEFLNKKFFKK